MKLLIPLPRKDFDPTEVAIPWKVLRSGCEIVFATPDGMKSAPDEVMLTGTGLGPLGEILRADRHARHAWKELQDTSEFNNPLTYEKAREEKFSAILFPGGHAPGMREYLESEVLQEMAKDYMNKKLPMAAICHGVLILARAKSDSGNSILRDRKVTTLLKSAELLAWSLTKGKVGDYFRTYPETTVEDEVRRILRQDDHFIPGRPMLIRDSLKRLWAGHAVRDENLVTARWAGDAHRFAYTFKEMLA